MSLSEKIASAESSDWLCKGMADEEVIKVISEAKEEARKLYNADGSLQVYEDKESE